MSHEEQGTVYDPGARGYERQGRKKAPQWVFTASDYTREDWTPEDLIYMLEDRAKGYNGLLQVLCTAAAALRRQEVALTGYRTQAISDMVDAEEQGERVANAKVKAHEDGTEMAEEDGS